MIMLTRSLEEIFNQMRYTGINYLCMIISEPRISKSGKVPFIKQVCLSTYGKYIFFNLMRIEVYFRIGAAHVFAVYLQGLQDKSPKDNSPKNLNFFFLNTNLTHNNLT